MKPRDIISAMEKGNFDKDKLALYRLFKSIDNDDYNTNGITFDVFMELLNRTFLSKDPESMKY